MNIKSNDAFKTFITSLKEMLKLRPELIESSSSIQEKAARVFEVRGDFFPTVNVGLVQDNVLASDYSNLSTSRQTTGGYLDAYVDMDTTLIDFGGRNAAFNAALIEKEIAYLDFDLTTNKEAFKYGKVYIEYSSKILEKFIYNDFEKDVLLLQKEVKERFKGGVTTIFEVNSVEQAITRFNIRSGDKIFSVDHSTSKPIIFYKGSIVSINTDEEIVGFNASNGIESWRSQKFKNRGLTNLILNDDKIYFGDFEGYIHQLDAETGMITGLTKTDLKSISQIATFSDKLFVQDEDGSIAGFSLK